MKCGHKDCREVEKFDGAPISRCAKCGLIFSEKHGKDFDPRILYEEYYRNEIADRFNIVAECIVRLFRFFRAFKIFTVYPGAKSALDIGSGRGFFLYYLKKFYGYRKAVGTQISENAVEFSRNRLGLEIYDKDLLELSFDNTFDIVTMWHVLEHIAEPEIYIEKIYTLLNKNGKLVIEVPNFKSWTRRLTKRYWLGLDLDYHITFFTPESLSSLLKKYNFKIKTVHTFSLEYSVFMSAQSIVSLITRTNHLFFKFLQGKGFGPGILLHTLLFIVISPLSLFINAILYFSKRGEVLFIIAQRD